MDFEPTERQVYWRDRVSEFIEDHVRPAVPTYREQDAQGERWKVIQVVEDLKAKAKDQGLWNLFMPPRNDSHHHVDESFEFEGPGLTNLEYALCAEEMGRIGFASEVFNCSAPDTGNMEVFHRYGTREQKDKWLDPLMNGEDPFCLPDDRAVHRLLRCDQYRDAHRARRRRIRHQRPQMVVHRGLGDPRCKVAIVMGKTDFEAKRHAQQSMILMPIDAEGVNILRHLPVFGYDDAPHGHMEVGTEGRARSGHEHAAGRRARVRDRAGAPRARAVSTTACAPSASPRKRCRRCAAAFRSARRSASRSTSIRVWEERVARARIDIDMTRLLCLKAADMMDKVGNKSAKQEIAMIKVQAPNMALKIIDDAIQAHGGGGVSDDYGLANAYAHQRTLRLADGPDEVHARSIARMEFAKHMPRKATIRTPCAAAMHTRPAQAAQRRVRA